MSVSVTSVDVCQCDFMDVCQCDFSGCVSVFSVASVDTGHYCASRLVSTVAVVLHKEHEQVQFFHIQHSHSCDLFRLYS